MRLRSEDESLWKSGNPFRNTEALRREIPKIFKELGIRSFVDVGCGDFLWLSTIDWTGISYLGIDIVQDLIERNIRKYPGFNFIKMNAIEKIPSKADMIFIRSIFIHLGFPDSLKIIENVKKSGSTYMMASTRENKKVNYEPVCLMLQHQNLLRPPFNFPKPLMLIKEMDIKTNNHMGVWKVNEL